MKNSKVTLRILEECKVLDPRVGENHPFKNASTIPKCLR